MLVHVSDMVGQKRLWALSYAGRSTIVFASFSPTQFSIANAFVPICAPMGCWSEKEVCSGTLLARCYFEELKIDCAIELLKPGLKSKVNAAIFIYFCNLVC